MHVQHMNTDFTTGSPARQYMTGASGRENLLLRFKAGAEVLTASSDSLTHVNIRTY